MARDFRQLVVWQLADELQTMTLELTRTQRWARDFDLRDEAVKTTSQMCRNITEGFRRHSHRAVVELAGRVHRQESSVRLSVQCV